MTVELTPEEAEAAFALAFGELQAIKFEEQEGQVVNETEINLLLALANKVNPDPDTGVLTWEQVPPAPPEDQIPD